MASIGVLAAGVAHEINNPVAFVLSNICVLQESLPALRNGHSDDWQDVDDIITESVEGLLRVKGIVRDLQQLSRDDGTHESLIDVNEAVRAASAVVQHHLSAGVRLDLQLDGSVPVRGHLGKLQQVVLNLLVNAADACGQAGTIEVCTGTDQAGVFVRIRDTGHGMDPTVLQGLFTPFFTTKGPGEGTGLGLYVSYGIVRDHNGEIEVESAAGKGTTFTVRLPTV